MSLLEYDEREKIFEDHLMNSTKIRDYDMFKESLLKEGLYGATVRYCNETTGLFLMNDSGLEVSIMDVRNFSPFNIPTNELLLDDTRLQIRRNKESRYDISTLNAMQGVAIHEIHVWDKKKDSTLLQFAIKKYHNKLYTIFVGKEFEEEFIHN